MFSKLDLKIKQPISGKTFALLIGLGVPGLLAIYYVLKQKNADSDAEGGFRIRDWRLFFRNYNPKFLNS